MKIEARTKLADRPVHWKEAYTPRTKLLKRQFGDIVGAGSYFRFEGSDTDTGDEYFVVVGPARIHSPKAEFFAGVRKLPSDFAAGGQYFPDMRRAMEYANQTWGVSVPSKIKNYGSSDLKGIKKKLDDWRDAHEGEESKAKEEEKKEASVFVKTVIATDTAPYFKVVEAMPSSLKSRTGYVWFDLDDLIRGSDPRFAEMAEANPSLEHSKNAALAERAKRRRQIGNYYGEEYVEADFYKIWLTFKPDEGTYMVMVGPYLGKKYKEQAIDKFYTGTLKLNLATQEEIDERIQSLIEEYSERFGVTLTPDDLNIEYNDKVNNAGVVTKPANKMKGEINIGKSGREKIYASRAWQENIVDFYDARGHNVAPGKGQNGRLKTAWQIEKEQWKAAAEAAYAESQESGEAFERQQPPPPKIDLTKRTYGQQIPTTVYKGEPTPGLSATETAVAYGFDSISEAIDRLNATVMPGAPVGDVPSTTTEDLRRARERETVRRETEGAQPTTDRAEIEDMEEIMSPETETPAPRPAAPSAPPSPPKTRTRKKKAPAAPPVAPLDIDFSDIEGDDIDFSDFDLTSCVRNTVDNLVRLSEQLDREKKYAQAEEVHQILRKHALGDKS
jgi:hypothetical protein